MTRFTAHDFEEEARQTLPAGLYDFIAGGAMDEHTLRNNRQGYEAITLHYRVLQGIDQVDTACGLFGQSISMPIITAPTGSQVLTHPDGELAVRRATSQVGAIMTVPTTATFGMEEIKQAGDGPLWFQLYMFKDQGLNRVNVERAVACGYDAIALTVDAPVFGRRERDWRNGYELPAGLTYENMPVDGDSEGFDVGDFMNANWKRDISWADVDWLREATDKPLMIKGLSHPNDAELAVEHGMDAVWISNHGGRQLDAAPATIDVLPAIAKRLARRIPIIVDGGIRRGTDIVKALALGATAVAIGRPMLWALAVDGEKGVEQLLGILKSELAHVMLLCGCETLSDIGEELIFQPPV